MAMCDGRLLYGSMKDLKKMEIIERPYVLDSLQKNTTKVTNIRKYMLAMLYNASATIDSYFVSRVNHDRKNEGKVLRGKIQVTWQQNEIIYKQRIIKERLLCPPTPTKKMRRV